MPFSSSSERTNLGLVAARLGDDGLRLRRSALNLKYTFYLYSPHFQDWGDKEVAFKNASIWKTDSAQ